MESLFPNWGRYFHFTFFSAISSGSTQQCGKLGHLWSFTRWDHLALLLFRRGWRHVQGDTWRGEMFANSWAVWVLRWVFVGIDLAFLMENQLPFGDDVAQILKQEGGKLVRCLWDKWNSDGLITAINGCYLPHVLVGLHQMPLKWYIEVKKLMWPDITSNDDTLQHTHWNRNHETIKSYFSSIS